VSRSEVLVRVSPSPEKAEAWSFVLQAVGIPHRAVNIDGGVALVVDEAFAAHAAAALNAHDRESAEEGAREPAAPDQGPTTLGAAMATALIAFFFVTGPRGAAGASGGPWFGPGSAVAEAIVRGAWWRAVTALTLHADLAHVMGNAVALIIFVSALGRWLGRGVALALVLLAGAAGNVLTAYFYGAQHDSVGASTAAFGALGILGGLQLVRRYRFTARLDRRRRALTVVAACLGLFAMLGVGERTDVVAHLAGLLMGLLVGAATGRWLRRPPGALGQWALTAASAATIVGCWLLAR
jgi:membrane associated rhomboid family serine protease